MRAGRAGDKFEYRSRNRLWDCWTWGTIFGLGGGVLAVVVGSALTAISWFTEAGSGARTAGTILLMLAIPLLVAGAEALDLGEKKERKKKESRCDEKK